MILILGIVSALMLLGAICTCSKWGQEDGICQYDYNEED